VKGQYREGLAIHPDPESCAGVRKEMGVAVTGVDVSRVLSREISSNTPGCLRSQGRRGATSGVPLDREVRSDPARSETPCAHRSTPRGRREIPWLATVVLWSAPEILREHDVDVRPWVVGHSIVLEKLPNKGSGAPQPAEGAEGRGLAKGNLVQQNRVRTQRRDALQLALDRIR
jgi:hypothetical protein